MLGGKNPKTNNYLNQHTKDSKIQKLTLYLNFLSTTHQNTDLTVCLFSTCVPRDEAMFKAKMKYFEIWNVKT